MSFSYGMGSNPIIDYPRLLISDTQEFSGSPAVQAYVFNDEEILAAYQIQAAQFQSSMFFSPPAGRNLPQTPVSYLRVSALLLNALASNSSRLGGVLQLLDVKLDLKSSAQSLRDQADKYLDMDDNAGAFAIIEQCTTTWAFRDRFWSQVQRQQGGGIFA